MFSNPDRRKGRIISSVLVGTGALFLIISLIPGFELNIALPLVFLMLGSAILILPISYSSRDRRAAYLYIPGCLLLSFGLIFLLNVLTGDWAAWAYAWLLLVAGAGLGVVITGRRLGWKEEIRLISESVVFVSVALFALFGAIKGGPLIQLMAPILLVLGGLALRFSGLESALLDRLKHRREPAAPGIDGKSAPSTPAGLLIEPLSKREIEVLSLIDQGLSNAEIASRLTLAQSTVKTHINNIYGKLNVQTRTQAVKRGYELGLLDHRPAR